MVSCARKYINTILLCDCELTFTYFIVLIGDSVHKIESNFDLLRIMLQIVAVKYTFWMSVEFYRVTKNQDKHPLEEH